MSASDKPPRADPSNARNVVVNTDYGPVIANRNDTVIGHWIGKDGGWEKDEIELLRWVVSACYGTEPAVDILDVGANIGTHTIAFARFPFGRVTVHAFEAQRIVFQMLAGSVALNSLDNVHCHLAAVSSESGASVEIPAIDYDAPGDFGSFELEPTRNSDFVARIVPGKSERVSTVRLDDLAFEHARLMKIDTEGMENKVFAGAAQTIDRCRPVLFFEYTKTDFEWVRAFLRHHDYRSYYVQRPNVLSVPAEFTQIQFEGAVAVER